MKFSNDRRLIELETLIAVIAHSQIVVAECGRPPLDLPEGFEEADIVILDWIAANACRFGRDVTRM